MVRLNITIWPHVILFKTQPEKHAGDTVNRLPPYFQVGTFLSLQIADPETTAAVIEMNWKKGAISSKWARDGMTLAWVSGQADL